MKMAKNHNLPTIADYISLILLFLIHTIDMELTRHYIGNDWNKEVFGPMRYCIKHFGIYNSIWISRIAMYGLVYTWCFNRHRPFWKYLLYIGTALYWASMVIWMFTLGIWAMP